MMEPHLAAVATPRQLEILAALEAAGGSKRGAARALGIDPATVRDSLDRLNAKAGRAQNISQKTDDSPAEAISQDEPQAGKRILVLPDVQAKPGNDFSYLMRIGQYMVDKRPDRVICIGDFADLCSLSSYDKGKKSFEGRRYKRDVEASHEAMAAFLSPLQDFNERAAKNGEPLYLPEKDLFLGNHEHRAARAVEEDPKLDGTISVDDLKYKEFGWTVHPFLEVRVIEGIAFSHYFTSGVMGRPVSTAAACLSKKHMSCVQGHQQGLQIATGYRGDGTLLTSVIAGSCYEHEEDYLGPQGNKHWRGFLMLHDVHDGMFDLMPVSLSYINKKYPELSVPRDYAKEPVGAGEPA